MPDSRLMCASHELPPKVGDSTNADTTSRFVVANRRIERAPARSETMRRTRGGRTLTAPYDSRKTR